MKPTQTIQIRFCTGCGRDDQVDPMTSRHWMHGELCKRGEIVELRYQLQPTEPMDYLLRLQSAAHAIREMLRDRPEWDERMNAIESRIGEMIAEIRDAE